MYQTFPILERADVDVGAQEQLEFNVNVVGFGDGYEQRSAKGINSVKQVLDVTFTALNDSDAQLISDFIKARAGAEPFYFKFYVDEQKLYTCTSYSKTVIEKNKNTISMNFEEAFR
ncbi:phage tail protein [Vreelandella sedimenti]|uniref:phage tail protein n=1 Tax=Vreelandella sedimenti TaxID=2729618 RepID=UPI00257F9CB3|nr:phage tail protein [Halomonas sp. UBA3173]|tara:strand:- start:138802 stop:139149 length:348 start_codon:yes stop_codon:yes gene_type:complete